MKKRAHELLLIENGGKAYLSPRVKYDPAAIDTYIVLKCEICLQDFFPKNRRNIRCAICSDIAGKVRVRISSGNYSCIKDKKRRHITTDSIVDITRRYMFSTICCYCKRQFTDVNTKNFDHVIPLHMGGSSEADNIAICCKECNLSKCGQTLETWKHSCECIAHANTLGGL